MRPVVVKRFPTPAVDKEFFVRGKQYSGCKCPPLDRQVGCSIHGHWVNCRNAPWARAFTSDASVRSTFEVSTCCQLPPPKPNLMKRKTFLIMHGRHNFHYICEHSRIHFYRRPQVVHPWKILQVLILPGIERLTICFLDPGS